MRLNKFIAFLMSMTFAVTILVSCVASPFNVAISFDSNGGTEVSDIIYDGINEVDIPQDPTKAGYSFAGWFLDDEIFEEPFTFSSILDQPIQKNIDLIVYAKWIPVEYQIIYVLNGGTNDLDNPTTFNVEMDSIILRDPTREGYTFEGWYTDENLSIAYNFMTIPTNDIILYAKWNINSFTLRYVDIDNTVLSSSDFEYNADLSGITPPEVSKEGYTFIGWDIEIPTNMPAYNVTLKARYVINQYSITFETQGGSTIAAITQDYASTVTAPINPTKQGYTFGGWYSDTEFTTAFEFTTMPANDLIIYAKWNINSYTLQFINHDNTVISASNLEYGSGLGEVIIPVASRIGYTFTGWDIDLPESMPANNVTLKAQYSINQYTITFDPKGGTTVDHITQDFSTVIAAPISPTKEGYTFGGWYADENLSTAYEFTTMPAQDITIYAKWNINSYKIIFDTNGGSDIEQIMLNYNSTIELPSNPIKQGYTFDDWFTDEDLVIPFNMTFMPSTDLTIHAKWTPNLYEVTFIQNNGENNIVEIDYAGSELFAPTYKGYSFAGWYTDIELTLEYLNDSFPTENSTLYAKWELEIYTISYEMFDGVNNENNPSTYTILSPNFIFKSPTKDGHTFLGWYDNELFEGNVITFQLQGTTEDKIYYAKWIINEYELSYYLYENYNPIADIVLYPNETIEDIALGKSGIGMSHSIALTSYGRVFTWGNNQSGQLGDGTTENRSMPFDISLKFDLDEGEKIVSIFAGSYYSGAITSFNQLYLWGDNTNGQLGDSSKTNRSLPTNVTNQIPFNFDEFITHVALGGTHTLIGTSNNRIFIWGQSWTAFSTVPQDITNLFNLNQNESILEISAGRLNSAISTSFGRLFVWGLNYDGQLGNGTNSTINMPEDISHFFQLAQDELIVDISLQGSHSAAVTSFGRIYTWGQNTTGELGDLTNISKNLPIDITSNFNLDSEENIVDVEVGVTHTTAITSMERLFTWGWNSTGQLGDITSNYDGRNFPKDTTNQLNLVEDEFILSSESGDFHSAIVTSNGRILMWGANTIGQLGDGTTTNQNKPVMIRFVNPAKIKSEVYSYGSAIDEYYPTIIGYKFNGWYTFESYPDFYVIEYMPDYDLNLFGYWIPIQYNINYSLDGGTNVLSNPVNFTIENDTIYLLNPTKIGNSFQGWYDNEYLTGESITSIPQGSIGDITLYAKWEINSYTLTFETYEGSIIEPITQEYNSIVTAPSDPMKQGYTFAGWFTSQSFTTQYTFTTMPAQDLTLYAKWEPNVYVTTYVLNNGQQDIIEVDYAGSELLIPTFDGFEFGGWFINVELTIPYESSTFPTQNMTLYTKWYEIFNITYHLDGGTNNINNPTSYTSHKNIDLFSPTKDNHIFIGWFINAEFTGDSINQIITGSSGDIQLHAKWEQSIFEDLLHDFYVTGNFAGWSDAIGNVDYQMETISKFDPKLSSISSQLSDVVALYYKEITLPTTSAGWSITYKIDGIVSVFDGNLTLKIIRTNTDDLIPNWWGQSPESGSFVNLTPSTLYIPPYVEENVDQAGGWNDNLVAKVPGTYYLVYVLYQGSQAVALIPKV